LSLARRDEAQRYEKGKDGTFHKMFLFFDADVE
jgi:hypothetical protein